MSWLSSLPYQYLILAHKPMTNWQLTKVHTRSLALKAWLPDFLFRFLCGVLPNVDISWKSGFMIPVENYYFMGTDIKPRSMCSDAAHVDRTRSAAQTIFLHFYRDSSDTDMEFISSVKRVRNFMLWIFTDKHKLLDHFYKSSTPYSSTRDNSSLVFLTHQVVKIGLNWYLNWTLLVNQNLTNWTKGTIGEL